eukprot:1733540-Pyramimonas_sp.AAC.1
MPVTSTQDVYSFGMTLWECLARKTPWEGVPQLRVSLLVASQERLRMPTCDAWPQELKQLMAWCAPALLPT